MAYFKEFLLFKKNQLNQLYNIPDTVFYLEQLAGKSNKTIYSKNLKVLGKAENIEQD